MPHELGTSPSIREAIKLEIVGFTLAGTLNVNVQVFDPIFVLPL